MDPVTLFTLANGAVSAIKAGCKLYKEIKSVSGDVRGILKELDDQFHKNWQNKKPPTSVKNQHIKEKNRVIELNKKSGDTTGIYTEIGEHLGIYYDNFYKCMAVFEEEEKRNKNEVYTGDSSLGKRALQRVLMRKQLEHMNKELRELMVYQCPSELGALWTEVNDMMLVMGKEQKVAISEQMRRSEIQKRKNELRRKEVLINTVIVVCVFITMFILFYLFMLIIDMRIERYPLMGNCPMPKGSWLYYTWTKTIWATCK